MTTLEKRKVQRSNNVLIVNFREVKKSNGYLLGVANNYSHKGISFEAASIESGPGDELELILKNPYSELSISATGEVVWKMDGWYKCMTGLKLKDVDQEALDRINDLTADLTSDQDEPPSLQNEKEIAKETEKEDIVADEVPDETAPGAEIIYADDSALSNLNEEDDFLPVEERTEISSYRTRVLKYLVKIKNNKGLLLAAVYTLLTTVALIFTTIRLNNVEQTQQPVLSQKIVQGPQLPPDKGNTGVVPARVAVTAVSNTEDKPEVNKEPEKAVQPENAAAVRKQPLQRGEIIFDSDSDAISPVYRAVIDKFAKAMLKDRGATMKIDGYSDSIGPELYNLDLAMRRALEVKKLLIKNGINDRKMKVTVYGESYPVSSDLDELDSVADRRVEIIIIPSAEAAAQ